LRNSDRLPVADVFFDDMDFIDGPGPTVVARLTLLAAEDGGIAIAAGVSFRPNHNFGGPDDLHFYIGQVDFGAQDMAPGESRDVAVQFLPVRSLPEKLVVGRVWRLQSGRKLLGTAEILSVVQA